MPTLKDLRIPTLPQRDWWEPTVWQPIRESWLVRRINILLEEVDDAMSDQSTLIYQIVALVAALPASIQASVLNYLLDNDGKLRSDLLPPVSSPVNSVFGRTGNISSQTDDYSTDQVTEGSNLYFTAARVLASRLAGLNTSLTGAPVATDTVLQAIGRLTGRVNQLLADSGVSAGSYANANITVGADGRITAASNGGAVEGTSNNFQLITLPYSAKSGQRILISGGGTLTPPSAGQGATIDVVRLDGNTAAIALPSLKFRGMDNVSPSLRNAYQGVAALIYDSANSGWVGYPNSAWQVDPFSDQVALLTHFDGTNNSTVFTDTRGTALTAQGGMTLSTVQSRFGGSSAFFDGSNDAIGLPRAAFNIPNLTTWTVEFWVYPISGGPTDQIIFTNYNLPGGAQAGTVIVSNRGVRDGFSNSASVAAYPLPLNTWTHVAVVYTSTPATFRLFYNGIQQGGSITSLNAMSASSSTVFLGGSPGDNNYGNWWFRGYLDEIRITAAARYTSNFTPPSSAFPDF